MLQISEIVRKTEEMFDLFNKHFYEGELSRPAITVRNPLTAVSNMSVLAVAPLSGQRGRSM